MYIEAKGTVEETLGSLLIDRRMHADILRKLDEYDPSKKTPFPYQLTPLIVSYPMKKPEHPDALTWKKFTEFDANEAQAASRLRTVAFGYLVFRDKYKLTSIPGLHELFSTKAPLETWIHHASEPHHIETLLYLGVNPNSLDDKGQTLLHKLAASTTAIALYSLFEDGRLDPNQQDLDGQTPLHIAALSGNHQALYSLFADRRLDLNLRDKKGYTPIDRALLSGNSATVHALLAAGAHVDLKTVELAYFTPQFSKVMRYYLGLSKVMRCYLGVSKAYRVATTFLKNNAKSLIILTYLSFCISCLFIYTSRKIAYRTSLCTHLSTEHENAFAKYLFPATTTFNKCFWGYDS